MSYFGKYQEYLFSFLFNDNPSVKIPFERENEASWWKRAQCSSAESAENHNNQSLFHLARDFSIYAQLYIVQYGTERLPWQ